MAGNQEKFSAKSVSEEANNQSSLELQRKQEAEAAGVRDARFIDYAEVLANYNQRSDTEPLADRRARHLATDAGQQSFTRAADYDGVAETAETQYPTDGGWAEADHSPEDTTPEETP